MAQSTSPSPPPAAPASPGLPARLLRAWNQSLRFRLIALGLMPLLVAFPIVIAILLVIGGERTDELLRGTLRSSLTGARSYLEQVKNDASLRLDQLVKSERLTRLIDRSAAREEVDELLATAARSGGLDYLLVIRPNGEVIASARPVKPGARLPSSHVIRQAAIGVTTVAFERFEAAELAEFDPRLPTEAAVSLNPPPAQGPVAETRGLMINAAAHFPLRAGSPDAILVGGILLNSNAALIEHLREILFPVGSLPADAEGITHLHVGDVSVAVSRQRRHGQRELGVRAAPEITHTVLEQGQTYIDIATVGGERVLAGFDPLLDGEGRRIGMLGTGIPNTPYRDALLVVLTTIAVVLAVTMLILSLLFLRAGEQLSGRLHAITNTMTRVRQGEGDARLGAPGQEDEIGQLARHFDELLDTVARHRENLEALVRERTRELNLRNQQLDAIFTLSPDGFVSFDPSRHVSYASPAFLAMFQLGPEEMQGLDEAGFVERLARRCLPATPFPALDVLRSQAAAPHDPKAPPRRHLVELVGPGERVVEVGIRLSAANPVSQVLYFRDVTHETVVDRMKSEFLSTAAHELRTPMASIYGFAELLLISEFPEAERRDLLQTIFRQAGVMAAIINELLDLSRIEARRGKDFKVERLLLRDVATEAAAGFKPPDERPPPVLIDAEAPLAVNGDRQKMGQCVLNVLSNAYKYSAAEAPVSLRLKSGERDGIAFAGIEIEDRGIGMTPEQLAHVCERFYRADTSGRVLGTGLGMAIVKEIVELHGGRVELASRLNEGTRVTLWFPAA